MAVRLDADVDEYTRTTSPTSTTAWTMMAWVYVSVDRNNFTTFFQRDNAGAGFLYVGTTGAVGNPGLTLMMDANGSQGEAGAAGTTLTLGTWTHLCYVRATNQHTLYRDGVSDITYNVNDGNGTGNLRLAEDTFGSFLNGRLAAVKVWDGASLSVAEIQSERFFYRAVRRPNLWGEWPMLSTADDEVDFSGNARNWTVGGTIAVEDGPPILWAPGLKRIWASAAAGGVTVTPGTAALTLATFAATVLTPRLVTPGTLALLTSLFAPSVTIGTRVTPATAALITSLFAPTVTATANQLVTPGAGALLTTLFAPSIVVGVRVVPDTAALIITTFDPTVTGGGITEHHFTVGRSAYKRRFRDSLKNYLPEG